MPGKHSNDIIKGNIDRRRSWHTFPVSITVLFKTPLPWPTPPLLPTETRMETLPRPTYQSAAQRTDAPTLTRDHRLVGAAFHGPAPGRFFPSPTRPHMQTRMRFEIRRTSNHHTRHTENGLPIYAIYRTGGPSMHLADG